MVSDTINVQLPVSPELLDELARRVTERIGPRESNDGWLDAKGAAAHLAIPRSTLHKLTASREIPFSQDVPGGKLYFKRSDLDKWREGG
jgi:excisionase family DNA binding protein